MVLNRNPNSYQYGLLLTKNDLCANKYQISRMRNANSVVNNSLLYLVLYCTYWIQHDLIHLLNDLKKRKN